MDPAVIEMAKTQKEQKVAEEYLSSLTDLNMNSKPLINMLTMLAEENIEYAPVIVKVVEQHIAKVHPDFKLPILYLIDSIVKNVKSTYIPLFSQCIVNIFCGVFEKVKENIRERMYALRQTWNEVFAPQKLFALDVKVKRLDANWPITAKHAAKSPAIHVNPDFLKTNEMEETLRAKTRELLELKKRKLELELEATKKHLEEQEKQLTKTTESVIAPSEIVTLPDRQPAVTPIVPLIGATAIPQPAPHRGGIARSALFHNYRNPRPGMAPNIGMGTNSQIQSFPMAQRPRVYPVNSAMINSIRHRDPRLARQQQQPVTHFQQQQTNQTSTMPMPIAAQSPAPSNIANNSRTSSESKNGANIRNSGSREYSRSSKSEQVSRNKLHSSSRSGSAGSGCESKSPTRHHSSGKSSSSRSSSKYTSNRGSSSSNNSREKGRNRSKTSSSPSTPDKRNFSSSTANKSKIEEHKSDKITVSNSYKRKSTSPISPSIKIKDAKRSSKPRTYVRKNKSRSSSPELIKDIDLRIINSSNKSEKIVSPLRESDEEKGEKEGLATKTGARKTTETFAKSTNAVSLSLNHPDQNVESKTDLSASPSCKDVDLRQLSSQVRDCKTVATTSNSSNVETTSSITDINSTAVSSKVKKLPHSATTNLVESINDDNSWSSNSSVTFVSETSQQKSSISSKVTIEGESTEDVTKKRFLPATEDIDSPIAKKSKSEKIDTLFGTEDVDLRTVIPRTLLSKNQPCQTVSRIMTPPPPPVISTDEQQKNQVTTKPNENWAKVKGSKPSQSASVVNKQSPKKSSLEDVRAKLAKAAKYNKFEKFNRDLSQRLKTDDLLSSDEAQEGKDENIRTIMLQAQEMLETQGLKDEQYQKIIHTVMSLNEANKLMEAKRRESLGSTKVILETNQQQRSDDPEKQAREAILKKRIPKLNRDHQIFADNQLESSNSPIYEEKTNETKSKASNKEKRVKVSKWGDRIDVPTASLYPAGGLMLHQQQQKSWLQSQAANNQNNNSNTNKRGFRGASTVQTQHHSNLNNHRLSTQMPSPWQNANINAMSNFNNVGGLVPAPPPPIPPIAPQIIPKACNSIDNPQADMMRSITIDGRSKEIRIYDDIAIVFMDWDQPREIGFQAGQRSITIDNLDPIVLHFNDDYKPIIIEGQMHRISFGFPSRELYIDEHWYEVYFGGPPVQIPLQTKTHLLKAEGPPPQVNIGNLRRDLVVGKINLIVDALIVIPIFLDAKPQTFQLDGQEHIIQFADNLLTVVIDGNPMQVEYGGLPKSMILGEKKYFVRFGALPNGVIPGKISIKDMIYIKTEKPIATTLDRFDTQSPPSQDPDSRSRHQQQQQQPAELKPSSDVASIGVDQEVSETAATVAPAVAPLPSVINIDELFQKLVSSGILGKGNEKNILISNVASETNKDKRTECKNDSKSLNSDSAAKDEAKELIRPIDLTIPENIKTRQSAVVSTLYCGMQCSSCGVRFPPEQTIKYSQHLDWHFRQNRRERDSTRKAHSRKWYYDIGDWVQYEEIEDIEDREKNFFEAQQNDVDIFDETSNQHSRNSPVPSCPAGPEDVDRVCDMCQEKFEQFYNEELEEWHLRSALRLDNKIYHPLCYEDYKTSLQPPKEKEPETTAAVDDDNAVDVVIKIESDDKDILPNPEVIEDDDDDDVIILPVEEPTITEIDDDEEYVPAAPATTSLSEKSTDVEMNETRNLPVPNDAINSIEKETASEIPRNEKTSESDVDVEIQEPNIPFTDLDTYVEKQDLSSTDDVSQSSALNVRIKEEPKDVEDDEDDGFEDVGTVVVALDEEISITSSDENTQTHTIASTSSTAPSPVPAISLSPKPHGSVSSPCQSVLTEELEPEVKNLNADLEQEEIQNLSTANPTPVTVSNLVNRIKINITKNIVPTSAPAVTASTNNSNDNNSTPPQTIVKPNSLNQNELNSSSSNNSLSTISTIPVLCSGIGIVSNNIPKLGYSNVSSVVGTKTNSSGISAISVIGGGSSTTNVKQQTTTISSIPVVGSYIVSAPKITTRKKSQSPPPQQQLPPPPPPVPSTVEEDTDAMDYELKPELQKVKLKKMKKVECGLETSGLCSIM